MGAENEQRLALPDQPEGAFALGHVQPAHELVQQQQAGRASGTPWTMPTMRCCPPESR
ncbi:MAG: hypothetical protein U0521_03540 [Anaerolineae bacterium]